jgi:hypothetical protein
MNDLFHRLRQIRGSEASSMVSFGYRLVVPAITRPAAKRMGDISLDFGVS